MCDGVDVHLERRLADSHDRELHSVWARGMGGSTDFTTQGGHIRPEIRIRRPAASICLRMGSDQRRRTTPCHGRWRGADGLGIDVAPSFTAADARPFLQAPNPSGGSALQGIYLRDANGNRWA
jgi:hypothetical protein